jgi:hypothetical protein
MDLCMLNAIGPKDMSGAVKLQSWHSQLTYAHNIQSAVCVEPPEDEQVRLETFIGP